MRLRHGLRTVPHWGEGAEGGGRGSGGEGRESDPLVFYANCHTTVMRCLSVCLSVCHVWIETAPKLSNGTSFNDLE